jgi:hypothetical protein
LGKDLAKWTGRVGITVALLALVTWRLDLGALARRALRVDPGWIAAAFGVVLAAVAVSA